MARPDTDTVETFAVPADAAGLRLDKWLAEAAAGHSRSRLQALIAAGAVTIAGRVVLDAAHKLKSGATIELRVPAPEDPTPTAQAMGLDIVYEDEHLIVINKPPGLVVHPAPGNPDHTLVNALLAHCGDSLQGIGGVRRPGIVHRIDKDTSGLLVAAKTAAAHAGLAQQFAAHSIARAYEALVWGVPRPAKGTITGAIGRSTANRKKMTVVKSGGRAAETGYRTLQVFGTHAAHVECRLKTGRTHQIRVHMTSRGHPLIGDPVYGGKARQGRKLPTAAAAALAAFPRQALHAAELGFTHPVTGKVLLFRRPPPDDFAQLLEILKSLKA